MRKPSQILKLAMPTYRKHSDIYMCCLIEDAYKNDGVDFPVKLTLKEQRVAKAEIIKRISPFGALMSFMVNTDEEYKRIHDREMITFAPAPRVAVHYSPKLQAMRVQWFENLIQELEKEGK